MTIRKNTNKAKQLIANARNIRCYSLSNNFTGQPLAERPRTWAPTANPAIIEVSQSEFLARELSDPHVTLRQDLNGRYCIDVHSNLWYEFESEFPQGNDAGAKNGHEAGSIPQGA